MSYVAREYEGLFTCIVFKSSRPERQERPERFERQRPERFERQERPERQERLQGPSETLHNHRAIYFRRDDGFKDGQRLTLEGMEEVVRYNLINSNAIDVIHEAVIAVNEGKRVRFYNLLNGNSGQEESGSPVLA